MVVEVPAEAPPDRNRFRRVYTGTTVQLDHRPVHRHNRLDRNITATMVERLVAHPVPSHSHRPLITVTMVQVLRAVRQEHNRSRCNSPTDTGTRRREARQERSLHRTPLRRPMDTATGRCRWALEVTPGHTRSPPMRRTTEAIMERADRIRSSITDSLRTGKDSECA